MGEKLNKLTYAASKSYTDASMAGGGAVRGKNCKIQSITDITGGKRVVFLWSLDNGTEQTSAMDVMNGADGKGIASITQSDSTITVVFDDGTSSDPITIPTVKGDNGDSAYEIAVEHGYVGTEEEWLASLKGEDGEEGFSPTITVKESTSTRYVLTVTNEEGSYDTPNLKGGGASTLGELTDVALSSPTDGQILKFNGTTWENANVGTVTTDLGDLGDVDFDNLSDGQIIVYDATSGKWKNANNSGVTIDPNPTSGSENAVSSGGVYTALASKVDTHGADRLMTAEEGTKLSGIAAGAEVNVQADWEESDSSSDAFIVNKPTIPAAQVNSDWSAASGVAEILHKPTLGTAAAKDSTSAVTSGSTDLVESGAVKNAIDNAVSSAYHAAGTKTVAELTSSLLIAANEGDVYNMTDAGTTTADFIEGAGKAIRIGDNVGVAKVGANYKFDLLSGFIDTSNFIEKSATSGLVKNDGTIDESTYATTSQLPDITGKADMVTSATSGDFAGLDANGNLTDSGSKAADFATAASVSAILDGTTIDSFADVETALGDKADATDVGTLANLTTTEKSDLVSAINEVNAGKVSTTSVGAANGVASLGADGKVPTSQLPASSGPSPYASNPAMDGTASPGVSNDYARGDHVHPSDTSKLGVNDKAASASVADAVENSLTITSDSFNKTYNGSGAATIRFVRLTNDLLASGWSATTDSQGYYTISQGGARIDGATGRVQLQPGQSQAAIDAYNAIASIDVDGSSGAIIAKTKVKPSVNIPIYIIGVQIS